MIDKRLEKSRESFAAELKETTARVVGQKERKRQDELQQLIRVLLPKLVEEAKNRCRQAAAGGRDKAAVLRGSEMEGAPNELIEALCNELSAMGLEIDTNETSILAKWPLAVAR